VHTRAGGRTVVVEVSVRNHTRAAWLLCLTMPPSNPRAAAPATAHSPPLPTPAGGFVALAIAQRKQLEDVAVEYEALRAAFAQQSAVFTEVKRFAVGVSHQTSVVDDSTRRFFGRLRLSELPPSPKVFVVCAAVDAVPPQPYLFRSYELTPDAFAASEFMGTANVLTHEAARATTSAPTFYAPAVIGGQRMVDGAILANNPILVGLSEAALLWPGAPIDCVVSVGTGTNQPKPFPAGAGVMAWLKQIVELSMNPFVAHKIASTLLGPDGGYGGGGGGGAGGGRGGGGAGHHHGHRHHHGHGNHRRGRGGSGGSDDASADGGGTAPDGGPCDRYFRFDVEGMGDVDISEIREAVIAGMLDEGRRYIVRNDGRFRELAVALGYGARLRAPAPAAK
jgi:hypothetical protein